jgi:tetratricopeptide (TPR) repeat protein
VEVRLVKKKENKKAIPQEERAKVISLDEYRKGRVGKQALGKVAESVKTMGNARHSTRHSAGHSGASYKVGGELENPSDILEKFRMAEYLITIAMSVGDNEEKVGIAEEALKTFPDFTAAYNILAEFKAKDGKERLAYFQKGVEAWERFHQFLVYESSVRNAEPDLNPYFNAMKGVADSLWAMKRREESLVQYWNMLNLEKHDSFGIRFIIMARLLEMGKNDEFYNLVLTIPSDTSSVINWGKVLYYFRRGEKDKAVAEIKTAMKGSPRVADYLLGTISLPFEKPRYDELSKKTEQGWAASLLFEPWKSTVGALGWLKEILKKD